MAGLGLTWGPHFQLLTVSTHHLISRPLHGRPNLYNLWHHRAGSLWVLPPTHAFSLFLLEACGFTVSHCEALLF